MREEKSFAVRSRVLKSDLPLKKYFFVCGVFVTLFSVSNRFCSVFFDDFRRSIDGHKIEEFVCRV